MSTPAEPSRSSPESPPQAILVVEDEPGIVDFIRRGLEQEGFEVLTAADGEAALAAVEAHPVDLVVLDLLLPKVGGLEVLEQLRDTRPALPVIALTALGSIDDRVRGLEAGAIDYLSKPFSLQELIARIRAQLRGAATGPSTKLRGGDIELDLITRRVRRRGEEVRLSGTEFELLAYLMRNSSRVLAREQILRAVWGIDHDPGTNVVDVYVGYLRRKLTREGSRPPIVTVRSVGYRFDAATAPV